MNKTNFKFKHISYNDFNLEKFIQFLTQNLNLNTTYSLVFKISCDNNSIFKMCGPQIGIAIGNKHDLNFYQDLYELINTRIETTADRYNYIETIEVLEIMYSVIIPQEDLILKNISHYNLNQQLINLNKVNKNFSNQLLPLTLDTSYYGYNIVSEERVNIINFINSKTILNTTKNKITIEPEDQIFIYSSKNKKFIIVSKTLNNNNFIRYIFDYKTGLFIEKVRDTKYICIKTNKVLFDRTIANVTLTIDKDIIIKYRVNNKLQPIKSVNKFIPDRNTNFGTFDLETFKDLDGLSKVYALGFYTNKEESAKLFYLTDYPDLNSYQLILKCLDEMLVSKYHNNIFYVHNLANYDIVFLYNVLLETNLKLGHDYYILKTTLRENKIIKLDIKIKKISKTNENKYNFIKISLVDSLNLLNYSLDKLTHEFNIETKKGKFPHSFVNKNTLNYIGNKPDKSFFDNMDQTEYINIQDKDWNLKTQCLEYLAKDLKGLLEVLNEFSRLIYIYFNIQMVDYLTITSLALNIFKQNYYKIQNIPSINKIYLFNFIKEAYFGGITEVYKPFGKNLVYIDANSLYPHSSLNPLPGTDCFFVESFLNSGLELEDLFGVFYAKVKTNDLYLGLLPIRTTKGLIFPNGEFEGIWSSEELKFAKSKGYEITVTKGYQFNKVNDTFSNYILDLYKYRKNSEGFLKLIFKSLLNNFLGRFGLNIVKPITLTVNRERRDFIFSTRVVHSETILNENQFLITFNPVISNEICLQHGLDVIKVLEKDTKTNIENNLDLFQDVSIVTAVFVNSYARIFMNSLKLEVLEKGGSIYYSDTDSLVLEKDFLNLNWLGKELGQFKLEYQIKEAYFISNKTYCLLLNNEETIIKTKGVINKSLNLEQFKEMYFENKNILATKYNTLTNYAKASVLIEKKEVILNHDSYTKREKIYNTNGLWIDTKPLKFKNKQ